MAKNWYSITARANEAHVYIFDEVGGFGVTAKAFIKELQGLAGKPLTLHVNSPGGDMFEALAIFNALDAYPGHVTAIVEGVAASAASFIITVADHLVMPTNAMLMIHNASGSVGGGAESMRQGATLLENLNATMASAYATKSGLSEARVAALMAATTWMTAEEAKAMGFCDEVRAAVKVAAHHNISNRYPNAPHVPETMAEASAAYWVARGKAPKTAPVDPADLSDLVPTPHRTAAEAIAAFGGRFAGRR